MPRTLPDPECDGFEQIQRHHGEIAMIKVNCDEDVLVAKFDDVPQIGTRWLDDEDLGCVLGVAPRGLDDGTIWRGNDDPMPIGLRVVLESRVQPVSGLECDEVGHPVVGEVERLVAVDVRAELIEDVGRHRPAVSTFDGLREQEESQESVPLLVQYHLDVVRAGDEHRVRSFDVRDTPERASSGAVDEEEVDQLFGRRVLRASFRADEGLDLRQRILSAVRAPDLLLPADERVGGEDDMEVPLAVDLGEVAACGDRLLDGGQDRSRRQESLESTEDRASPAFAKLFELS